MQKKHSAGGRAFFKLNSYTAAQSDPECPLTWFYTATRTADMYPGGQPYTTIGHSQHEKNYLVAYHNFEKLKVTTISRFSTLKKLITQQLYTCVFCGQSEGKVEGNTKNQERSQSRTFYSRRSEEGHLLDHFPGLTFVLYLFTDCIAQASSG